MINSEKIKQILLSEIEKINQYRENFCEHPGSDFSRDRKITLYDLLNKVFTDEVIQPVHKRNEFDALYELIDRHAPAVGQSS